MGVVRRPAGAKPPRSLKPKTHKVRIGNRRIVAQGLSTAFWNDFYHRSITVSWSFFVFAVLVSFLALNAFFAVLYALGDNAIAHGEDIGWLRYFYFSIETLATVGYGDMHPQTQYGHIIASVETFTGLFSIALMTGLVFTRFSRPQARLLFARAPVVSPHDGVDTLIIRVANARHNLISNAYAKLWMSHNAVTLEGRQHRRFIELPLVRHENPIFMLSWMVFHSITPGSPLYGLSVDDLRDMEASFILSIRGVDDASAQEIHTRQVYEWDAILWDHAYADILENTEQGFVCVNYTKFHDVMPVSRVSSSEVA